MDAQEEGVQARRRAVPGKGYRKSRKGCTSCKARRVKCSEELPTCSACRRLGLDCHYLVPSPSPLPPPGPALANTPSSLTFEDLRFFHYFLTTAHPKLPYGMAKVWQDVAALSHEYDFLAHALLGLAAERLATSTSSNYSLQALHHRVRAITAMNEALSTPCVSALDADARLATAIALTFQSTYMEDGMMEFLRTLRGWMVIQTSIVPSMAQSLFRDFTEEAYIGSKRTLLGRAQACDSSSFLHHQGLDGALDDLEASLHLVTPLCRTRGELEYLSSLQRIALLARTSPRDACLELVPMYAMTNEMDAEEFAHFVNETNLTAQILLVHFWMMGWLLDSHVLGLASGFALAGSTVLSWVERAAKRLPESHRKYVLWPLGMSRRQQLERGARDA